MGQIIWRIAGNLFACQDFGFVKILSQWRRKEGGQEFRSLEVREASSSHLKMQNYKTN